MSEQPGAGQRAQRVVAAIAAMLAEDEANLWADDLRALRAAQAVAQREASARWSR